MSLRSAGSCVVAILINYINSITMGQVTRGYAAAATALLLLSGASSFGKCYKLAVSELLLSGHVIEERRAVSSEKRVKIEMVING